MSDELDRIQAIVEAHELERRPVRPSPETDPVILEAQRVATAQGGSLNITQVHGLLKQKTGFVYKSKVKDPGTEKSSPVYIAVNRGNINSIEPELGGARQIIVDDKFIAWLGKFEPRTTD